MVEALTIERTKAMATQVGNVTANNINVLVSEHFSLVRVYQDKDQIIVTNLADLEDLILKLTIAKHMIANVKEAK